MRVGEIICRSETFLQEPSFKLPFDRAFIRSSSHSSAGGGDFRQTVIVAPSTACTRRAKNKKVRNQTVFKAAGRRRPGEYEGRSFSKLDIYNLQLSS
jgi:hypothetical protein